jgi:hypothetical protein
MKSVFGALGYAAANLLHPRMLWLMVWPMLLAAGILGNRRTLPVGADRGADRRGDPGGLDFFHLQAPDAAMIAAHAVLFLLFVPLVWLTGALHPRRVRHGRDGRARRRAIRSPLSSGGAAAAWSARSPTASRP